jgi:hypothetical protein
MYSQIKQGQAAAAQQKYYQQMMNQPHVQFGLGGIGEIINLGSEAVNLGGGIYGLVE